VTVLIIDDEEMIRDLTRKILNHAGFEVLTADSGLAGIRLYAECHATIDLVLLDLTMDDIPGIETLKKLREITPDLPCIISSGQLVNRSEIPDDLNHNLYFLQKPYRSKQLTETIQQALEKAGKRSEPRQQP
jgi:DNA-binding NtrC family response regulator